MKRYKIADLEVDMQVKYPTMLKQGEAYLSFPSSDEKAADITICISDKELEERGKKYPVFSKDDCEYMFSGGAFYNSVLNFNGMLLHSSCVALDGRGYMFSGKCGAGKSTHTGLWQEYFGTDKALIINDDKPCIRYIDNEFYVYGTPWSGKTDKNLNKKVPLECIVFLGQAKENKAHVLDSLMAVKNIMEQTARPVDPAKVEALLNFIDLLVKHIPVYYFECKPDFTAVEYIYEFIKKRQADTGKSRLS